MNRSTRFSRRAPLAMLVAGCLAAPAAEAVSYFYRVPNLGLRASSGGSPLVFRDNVTNAILGSIPFPDTAVGSNSPPQVVKVENRGTVNITFGAVPFALAAPFSLSGTTCSGTLLPGANCTATLVFSPPAAQTYSGSNLTVSSDAPSTVTIALSGTGTLDGVSEIVAGGAHTFIHKTNGEWWAAGYNQYGTLGLGHFTDVNVFTKVPSLTGAVQVQLGYHHTFAKKADGTWWSTGYNFYGQLGQGDQASRNTFTAIPALTGALQVVVGPYIAYAEMTPGNWVGTGGTGNDELGIGNPGPITSFTPIPGLNGATKVLPGADFSLAKMSDGSWKGAGWNGYGELGIGNFTNLPAAPGWIAIPALSGATKVAAGLSSAYAIRPDGTLWSTGYNSNGELGLGNWTNRNQYTQVPGVANAVEIATSYTHIFVRLSNGNWMAAGNADYNQLGLGDWSYHNSFVAVPALNGATKVITGLTTTFAQRADGKWYGVGGNDYGEMGLGGANNADAFTLMPPP